MDCAREAGAVYWGVVNIRESETMANFTATWTILDEDGDSSNASLNVVAADISAAVTRAQAMATVMDALIGGQITYMTVSQVASLPGGLKTSPAVDSDVEVKGRFLFNSAAGFVARLSLPTFLKSSFTIAGGFIDTGDVAVAAFLSEATSGGWGDVRFSDLVSLKRAYEAFGR